MVAMRWILIWSLKYAAHYIAREFNDFELSI